MDIHPPEGPTNSLRDFLIHIGIVTIGILIALGLESIEETVHFHHLVRDARENFHVELQGNRGNLDKELENDAKTLGQLDRIIADLPQLRLHPTELARRVQEVEPSGYFFGSSRWDSALSTGAIGHMSVDEVSRYSSVNLAVHIYTALENHSQNDWQQLEAFFKAHQNPTPLELNTGVERLFLYRSDVRGLDQVAKEFSRDLDDALKPQ